ncbi:MAG: retropepsin-like aspartic protease [Candidatus Omnitrophica bacterium]|nr:retropepsin-like aspartic protease [Candidatus Omnitrophota bacterium]MDD5592735.1 retropepsin-like aspartic protease [Candidatus Omnitrophota bacterium]
MKILITVFIFSLFLLKLVPQAQADVVYLKNGRQMEGVITQETNEYVELSIDFGSVKFYRGQIERIEHSSEKEKQAIEQSWEARRLKKEKESKIRQEEGMISPGEVEANRQGDHLFVNALLNRKVNARLLVDTGASFVVLSPNIAKQLNIDIKAVAPDIKLTLGDGKEVPAKLIKLDIVSVEEAIARDIDAAIIDKDDAFNGFDGVLGMSFLRLFKFEINLKENKLVLQKP